MTDRFPPDWDPKTEGYLAGEKMEDGRWWCLMPLTMGRLRIVIAEDEFTTGEHWCYSDTKAALVSFGKGPTVPPTGWSRHLRSDGVFERFNEHGEVYVDV